MIGPCHICIYGLFEGLLRTQERPDIFREGERIEKVLILPLGGAVGLCKG